MVARETRRLAAILAADVVAFTRLMEADEAGTLAGLRAARAEVVDPAIAEFRGRTVKTTGDGLLAEFGSAVEAVRSAIAIQEAMAARDGGLVLRIGINLGDVVSDRDDIYGDGVNLAARLEALATPGGIAVSGSVHEQIAGKIAAPFADAGEHRVKNITRAVRVWQWRPTAAGDRGAREVGPGPRRIGRKKPVVAVLPFAAAGTDAEAEALAEGLADDMTTAFSGRRGVEVVARGATAGLKGLASDMSSVRHATGADYVLTGALRRSATRLRVTAELINTGSGVQIWSSRYDRDWGDPFALQDELTERIASAARWAMNAYEGRQYDDAPESGLGNAERRAKAAAHFYDFTAADFAAAGRLLEAVLADDPDDAMALSMQAFRLAYQGYFDIHALDEGAARRALDLAQRAVELDRNSDYAYETRGLLALHLRADWEAALADAERALELSPQYGLALQLKGEALVYGERPAEGLALVRKKIELNPRDPHNFLRHWIVAMGHFAAGDYAEAREAIGQARQGAIAFPSFDLAKAAILARLARHDEALGVIGDILDRWPGASVRTIKQPLYSRAEDRERFLAALTEAGLPESPPRGAPRRPA